MKLSEIARLQQYLRAAFDNNRFTVKPPNNEFHPFHFYLF
mgnify:CR=1 FL=1